MESFFCDKKHPPSAQYLPQLSDKLKDDPPLPTWPNVFTLNSTMYPDTNTSNATPYDFYVYYDNNRVANVYEYSKFNRSRQVFFNNTISIVNDTDNNCISAFELDDDIPKEPYNYWLQMQGFLDNTTLKYDGMVICYGLTCHHWIYTRLVSNSSSSTLHYYDLIDSRTPNLMEWYFSDVEGNSLIASQRVYQFSKTKPSEEVFQLPKTCKDV